MDCTKCIGRLEALWTSLSHAALFTLGIWFCSVLYGGSAVWIVAAYHWNRGFCKNTSQFNENFSIDTGNSSSQNNSLNADYVDRFKNNTVPISDNEQERESVFLCLLREHAMFKAMFILIVVGSVFFLFLFIKMTITYYKEEYSRVRNRTIIRTASLPSICMETVDELIKSIHSNPLLKLLTEEDETDTDSCKQIQNLVYDTWIYNERVGKDAKALDHRKITITSVYKIENSSLWEVYNSQYEKVKPCSKHPEELELKPIKTVKDSYYSNESQIEGDNLLESSNIQLRQNEIFLFHGTPLQNVRKIVEKGFNLSKAQDGLYGKAIYLAESSEKADQYTDYSTCRRNTNLAMLVVRVTKGKILCHDKEHAVRIPLCGWIGARKPKYDTVVAGLKKRFREFLVFDAKHTYPAFVVLYNRE